MLVNCIFLIALVVYLKFCSRIPMLVLHLDSPYTQRMLLMTLENYVSLNSVVIVIGVKNTEKK